jgi:hypothetical protein
MKQNEMDNFIDAKKSECLNELTTGGGILEDVPQAIIKGVMWNTIYEPIGDRLCTPVSREWCTDNGKYFGSYVLFDWDTFFCGILSSIQDKEIAYQQIKSIFQEMTQDGMIPNFSSQRGKSFDRSQPPVGSYCILKLYRPTDGLPVGLQIMGKPFDESTVIRAAYTFEQNTNYHTKRPPEVA